MLHTHHAAAQIAIHLIRLFHYQHPCRFPNVSVDTRYRAIASSRWTRPAGSFAFGGGLQPSQTEAGALVWQPAKLTAKASAIHVAYLVIDLCPFAQHVD